jgi:hypothetical protein
MDIDRERVDESQEVYGWSRNGWSGVAASFKGAACFRGCVEAADK